MPLVEGPTELEWTMEGPALSYKCECKHLCVLGGQVCVCV